MTNFASRMFQTWEYRVSHGELFLRSPKDDNHSTNIDLMFVGVEYMDLPRHLGELEVQQPDETDISFIRERLPKQGRFDKIFVLISNGRRYRVVAAELKVSENELELFDSPFGSRTIYRFQECETDADTPNDFESVCSKENH